MILSTTKSDSRSSNLPDPDSIEYFLAQYTSDPFRREPKNVGVVVRKGSAALARFVGEKPDGGELDGRMLRGMPNAKAYRAWIRHWRKAIRDPHDWTKRLVDHHSDNFAFVPCGEVLEAGVDTLNDVCQYLFSLLVSNGGFAEAIPDEPDEAEEIELRRDVCDKLSAREILGRISGARHPVLEQQQVRGQRHRHQLWLFQETANVNYAIESINFATNQKNLAKDRAGCTSTVFRDLREATSTKFQTIAIVHLRDEDRGHEKVEYAMDLLRDNSHEIVEWGDSAARERFLAERYHVAISP